MDSHNEIESEDTTGTSGVSYYPQSDVGWLGCFTSSVHHQHHHHRRRLRSLESTTFPKSITGWTPHNHLYEDDDVDDVTDSDAVNNQYENNDEALHFSRLAVAASSSSSSLCWSVRDTVVSHPAVPPPTTTATSPHHHHHVRWIDYRVPSSCDTHDATTTIPTPPLDDLQTSREHLVHALPPLLYYRCTCYYTCNDGNQPPTNVHTTSDTTISSNSRTGQIPYDNKEEPNQPDSHRNYIVNQYSPWYDSSACQYPPLLPPNSAKDASLLPQQQRRQRTTPVMIADCTILVLPLPPTDNNQDYYSLLTSFRIGDILPSVALYSSMIIDLAQQPNQSGHILNYHGDTIQRLSWLLQTPPSLCSDNQETFSTRFCQVLIYRKLPPRALLSSRHPEDPNRSALPGCLYETVITYPDVATTTDDNDNNVPSEPPQQAVPTIGYRMVGPPYIDCHSHCADLYHHLQQFFLRPHVQLLLQQEVQRIQEYFIAWPEAQHYHATSNSTDDDDSNNNDKNDGTIVEAPWNVYPLCYCFPGNDVTQRQFISKTCQFVPNTIQLLQECFNSFPVSSTYTFENDNHHNHDCDQVDCFLLRTALFSRLEPDSVLEAHTGWADLANHVYRVHIPIHIPKSESTMHLNNNIPSLPLPLSSCCGTWVDGCVQYHDMNSIIMFDDSKVHRAFNYSQRSSRTVLILDVARPTNVYPIGTATGGHSNELDAFIEQFQ